MVQFTDAHKAEDGWTEIGGGDSNQSMWNREGTIIGKYVNKQVDVGPNDSNVYTIDTGDEQIGVWGSTVLDGKFDSIPLGSMVKIESLGKSRSKNGSYYYDYKVFSKLAASTEHIEAVKNVIPGAEGAA